MGGTTAKKRWRYRFNLKCRLFEQQEGQCWLCGQQMPEPQYGPKRGLKRGDLTFDHMLPKAQGGKFFVHNLKLAHMGCNSRRPGLEVRAS